jgi:hypothetical protein
MATNPILLAALTVTKPGAVGVGIAALVVLYLAFKVTKFVVKMLLVLAALVAIGLAVWSFYSAHHGSF